eukprot:756147-Hanusia_phi.AAC.1
MASPRGPDVLRILLPVTDSVEALSSPPLLPSPSPSFLTSPSSELRPITCGGRGRQYKEKKLLSSPPSSSRQLLAGGDEGRLLEQVLNLLRLLLQLSPPLRRKFLKLRSLHPQIAKLALTELLLLLPLELR